MIETQVNTIFSELVNTTKRFPIPIILGLVLCATQMYIMRLYFDEMDAYKTYIPALAVSCWLFLSLRLLIDGLKVREFYYYAIGAPLFCLIVWYVHFDKAHASSIFMLLASLSLSILTAPFFGSDSSPLKLWTFNYRIFKSICFAGLVALVLFTGIFTIAYAMESLLEFKVYKYFHGDIAVLVLGFISPMIVLSSMMKIITDPFVYPNAVRGLLAYAVLPLLYIFGFIVLCYGVKVCMNTSMIHGHSVSTLCISLACYAMIAYFLSYPIYTESGSISFFVRHFFLMLLLPVVFIALDVWYVISREGITNATYVKLLLLLWFTVSIALSFLRNIEELPRLVLTSLAILCFFSSFGPWGIAHAPITPRQAEPVAIVGK